MNRAIFLDRDNTLIHNDEDLGDPSQVKLIQGAASAIASLRGLGYRIIVVTNQGGVARGKYTEADVEAVNAKVNDLIVQTSGASIDRFYYCPYHPQGTVEKYRSEHPWRKPAPGMLLQAARDLLLDMGQSWMVGDQMQDIEAGAAAGVRTILLTPQAGAAQPPLLQDRMAAEVLGKPGEKPPVMPDFVARNIIEAVRIIAQQRRPEGVEDWRSLETSGTASSAAAAKTPRNLPVALSPATQRLADGQAESPTLPAAAALDQIPPAPVTSAAASTSAISLSDLPASNSAPAPAKKTDAATVSADPVATVPRPATTPPTPVPESAKPVNPLVDIAAPEPAAPPTRFADPSAGTIPSPAQEASPAAAVLKTTTAAAMPSPSSPPDAPASIAPTPSSPARTAGAEPGLTSRVAPPQTPVVNSPGMEQTLRQILAELRHQRQPIDEFNYTGTLAIVFQLLAVVCLLAALWMGRSDDGLFLRWLGVSILTQLIAIAMLLFKR